MAQVINPEGAGKERVHLARAVVVALRELMKQSKPDSESRDLAAFIALALERIGETIDLSVTAWEKRGYWVKADRFRMEWEWASRIGARMRQAVLAGDWGQVAESAGQAAQKLMGIDVSPNHRLGRPWVGAWDKLVKETNRSK